MRKAEAKTLTIGDLIKWGDDVRTAKCRVWHTGRIAQPLAGTVVRVTDIRQERRDDAPLLVPGWRYVEFPLIHSRIVEAIND